VLERFEAPDVHAACRDLRPREVRLLASLLDVPDVVLTEHDSAARAVRRRLRRSCPTLAVRVTHLLTEPTRALVVAALGDRHADPTTADLLAVAPEAVGAHGARRVALLLALAVDDEWPAAAACAEILTTDRRFALDALGPVVDDEVPARPAAVARREADPQVRERRRARKQQRRATSRERGPARVRYRRAKTGAAERTPGADARADPGAAIAPVITLNGEPVRREQYQRRPVRIVHKFPDIDRDDPLVGRIVLANIRYNGPIRGAKDRPCVLIAASGPHHLVVRTCYSEGGRRAGDFRSVEVSDLELAGLDRPTFVNFEERRISRRAVKANFGWLPVADWNQL